MKSFIVGAFISTAFIQLTAHAENKPGYLADYNYQVTDVATVGLTAKKLFDEQLSDGMDLKHSVCSNRSLVWSYDMKKRHNIQPGNIFVFFTADIWEGEDKGYMYHAGTYIVENGVEKVLEGSYPSEVTKPLTVVEWMTTEMNEAEGGVSGKKCLEITKADTDLTKYFYERYNLPRKRSGGKTGAPCYYRKVPGYVPYPATVAMIDFDGLKMSDYDKDDVWDACVDAFSGKNVFKRGKAKRFCDQYLGM